MWSASECRTVLGPRVLCKKRKFDKSCWTTWQPIFDPSNEESQVALPRLLLDAARLSCFCSKNVIDERTIRSISKWTKLWQGASFSWKGTGATTKAASALKDVPAHLGMWMNLQLLRCWSISTGFSSMNHLSSTHTMIFILVAIQLHKSFFPSPCHFVTPNHTSGK